MTSFMRKDGMPIKDPYEILGIKSTSSESEIKKAYRSLALQLHPDKQAGSLTDAQREALDVRFHEVKDARSFLLDAEHAQAKKKYDANLESERLRHVEEQRREKTMSSRRKRMRDELTMREQMAKAPAGGSSHGVSSNENRFDVDRLRREGERLREEYSKREAEVEAERKQQMAVERATKKLEKEDRQVRLKWSRKKVVGGVHTKQSLASILEDFGGVEEIEMLGSKGNAALITFRDETSCKPCVVAFRNSDTMRATFVGRRKIADSLNANQEEVDDCPPRRQYDENLEDRKLRQAAERERLMRQMEQEDADGGEGSRAHLRSQPLAATHPAREKFSSFPPPFPDESENKNLLPYELLEKYERDIFSRIELMTKE